MARAHCRLLTDFDGRIVGAHMYRILLCISSYLFEIKPIKYGWACIEM